MGKNMIVSAYREKERERERESERKIVFQEMYRKMEFTCMNIYEGWQ